MEKKLQKIGNSKALVLSKEMLSHLQVKESVDVEYRTGEIVIRRPKKTFEEAMEATLEQYDDALRNLAK